MVDNNLTNNKIKKHVFSLNDLVLLKKDGDLHCLQQQPLFLRYCEIGIPLHVIGLQWDCNYVPLYALSPIPMMLVKGKERTFGDRLLSDVFNLIQSNVDEFDAKIRGCEVAIELKNYLTLYGITEEALVKFKGFESE